MIDDHDTEQTVLIDLDDTAVGFSAGVHRIVCERLPPEQIVPLAEHRTPWFFLNYPPELRDMIRAIYYEPGFYLNLPPVEGAIDAMQAILERYEDVRICTQPWRNHLTCATEKLMWIERHLGAAWLDRTIIMVEKERIPARVLLDDMHAFTPEMLRRPLIRRPRWTHVLADAPHNRHLVHPHRLIWSRWREVLDPLMGF